MLYRDDDIVVLHHDGNVVRLPRGERPLCKGKPASFRLFPVSSYVVVAGPGSLLPALFGLLNRICCCHEIPLRLPRWGHKWVGFQCAAVFRQTVIQSVERRANLVQRNSDRRSGTLDHKSIGCTKSFYKFLVRDGDGNRVSFGCYVRAPTRSACLHTDGIILSPLQFPVCRFKREG